LLQITWIPCISSYNPPPPFFFFFSGGALAPTEVLLKVKVQIYSTKPDERREEES